MAEPFLGEIRMVAFNFAPRGWAFCDGQQLPISQNSALFSLLGTTYGGDGRTTFNLPDLRSRVPMHEGQGAALSQRNLGSRGGAETHVLTLNEIPGHNHNLQNNALNTVVADEEDPDGHVLAGGTFYAAGTPNARTLPAATANAGGGQPHTNMQPYLTVNFVIALQGLFPSRS